MLIIDLTVISFALEVIDALDFVLIALLNDDLRAVVNVRLAECKFRLALRRNGELVSDCIDAI